MDHLTHNDLVERAHLHDVLKLFVRVSQSELTCVGCAEGVREYVGCVDGVRECVGCVEGVREYVGCVEGVKECVGCVEGVRECVGCVEGKHVREWDVQECGCDVWKE